MMEAALVHKTRYGWVAVQIPNEKAAEIVKRPGIRTKGENSIDALCNLVEKSAEKGVK